MSIIPGSDNGFGGGGGGGGGPAPAGAVLYDAAQALSAAQAKQARDNIGAMTLLSYAEVAAFPVTGDGQTVYQANDTGVKYLWSGGAYELFSPNELYSDEAAALDAAEAPSADNPFVTRSAAIKLLYPEFQEGGAVLHTMAVSDGLVASSTSGYYRVGPNIVGSGEP